MIKLTLRAARINRGLSQKEVAKALGVDAMTVSRWERGVSHPSSKYIEPLCYLYNMHYDDISFCTPVRLKRI